jgi:hypothetical protein
MKSNTTLTATMVGRQFGKSMFGKNVTAVWADEAEKLFEKPETPVEYLEFNANPLALVCAMLRQGKQAYEAAEVLNGVGTRLTRQINIIPSIEREDTDRANAILKYFANKHTMRRIKGEWISEYMLALDDIVENPQRINKEHVKIVVSLPRIYEQNRALERVMKDRNSAAIIKNVSFSAMHTDLEFVDKVRLKNNGRDEVHYFWSTPKNYLVRFNVLYNSYGNTAWDCFAKHGKIHLSTEVVYTYPIKGYNFNVIQPNPVHMEITIL